MNARDWVKLIPDAGAGTLLNEFVCLVKLMYSKYGSAIEMEEVLKGIIPILDDLHIEEDTSPSANKIEEFRQKLNDAQKRIASSSSRSLENLAGLSSLDHYVTNFSEKLGWVLVMSEVRNMRKEREGAKKSGVPSLQTQQLPPHPVGLNVPVEDLKDRLFTENVKKVGVRAMGGGAKTTLAAALCQDSEVKDRFENIIFETVSQNPTSIIEILESMWMKIEKSPKRFHNVAHARSEIQDLLQRQSQRTLVILDDVWSEGDLDQLLFEAPNYKTLVTTRISFGARFDSCYELPLLEENDALSLFCFYAFDVDHIPERGYRPSLVEQVVAECKQLPLALKVVGAYLNGKPEAVWKDVKEQLSNAQPISRDHQEWLLERLAISVSALDDDVQLCFLDLGLFPEDKKIAVDSLFDIWIHAHNLNWIRAFRILLELEKQNLLVLINDLRNHPGTSHDSACELYVVQHDVLRDLAIYLANKKQPANMRKMLIMPRKDDRIPLNWEKCSDTEIISIHTGSMKKEQWPKMKFPKARVLVLLFTGNEYFLPPFLKTMAQLEVLIVTKQNSSTTKLEGMSAFTSLTQLKSVRFERLTVPTLESYSQYLKNLKKLSLSLCKGNDESNRDIDLEMCSKLRGLVEINIDHCPDIKKLPASICNLSSLEKLSITNCHNLNKLPEDLGKLAGTLVMLNLGACLILKALPDSICELGKLQFLGISHCGCINKLPNEFGRLQSLETLDIREACIKVKRLPPSAARLKSLSRVICDGKNKSQWEKIKLSLPKLQVEIAEQIPSLEWLEK